MININQTTQRFINNVYSKLYFSNAFPTDYKVYKFSSISICSNINRAIFNLYDSITFNIIL